MTLTSSYWVNLANDYTAAYAKIFGTSPPTRRTVLLPMAVAEHETENGRCWPGLNNFGAVQLRRLTADELVAFQNGTLKAGAITPGNPGGVLHIDTTPTKNGNVQYPVWFAAFPTQLDGVTYFLKVLLKNRPGCRQVCDDPMGTFTDLAKNMLITGYYEGYHPGSRPLGQRTDPLNAAETANVNDYTTALVLNYKIVSAGVPADWEPSQIPPPRISETVPVPPFDLYTVRGYQAALTYLAVRLGHPDFDPKGTDGVHGGKTDDAIKAFQAYAGIGIDGDVGPETREKMDAALGMAGVTK